MSKKKNKEEEFKEEQEKEKSTATVEEESVNEELSNDELMAQKMGELNDKYLRLYSDFENFRRRTSKEKLEIISNANGDVLKDLLAVVDDFERAIYNNENSSDADSIKEGFQLIYNKFINILATKGLKPMESVGMKFDLDQHEAITNIPVQEEAQKGTVIDVVEKGYFLNDKVLRYAKVVVGQ